MLEEPNVMLLYAAAALVVLAVLILILAAILAARKPKKPPTPTVAVRRERVREPYVEPEAVKKQRKEKSALLTPIAVKRAEPSRPKSPGDQPAEKQAERKAASSLYSPPPTKRKRATMRCVSGPAQGQAMNVGASGVVIGRDPRQSQFVFAGASSDVSRAHCKVSFDASAGTFILEDLGSTNGTFLSADKRLEPRQSYALGHGGRFYLSNPANAFELAVDEE